MTDTPMVGAAGSLAALALVLSNVQVALAQHASTDTPASGNGTPLLVVGFVLVAVVVLHGNFFGRRMCAHVTSPCA